MTRLLDGEKSFVRSLHVVWSSQQEWCQREKLALKGSPKFWRIISFTLPEIWRLANFLLHAIWRHMPFLPLRCHVVSLLALVLCASKAFPRHHWMVFRDMELLAHPVAFVPNDLFILRFQSVFRGLVYCCQFTQWSPSKGIRHHLSLVLIAASDGWHLLCCWWQSSTPLQRVLIVTPQIKWNGWDAQSLK